jgi:tRNA pseudouridine13 synthase
VKLKVTPRDFIVEEVADFEISRTRGPYAVYRLTKSSWDTFDLLDLLSRRIGVPRDAISVGGMKDRYGETTQLISVRSIKRCPASVRDKNFSATLEGYAQAPVTAGAVRGNKFTLVLRDMTDAEVRAAGINLKAVESTGIPNYYDEQRFGSARHGGGFMGKSIFLGKREEALKLYFLASKHDDQKTRKLKKLVTEKWGRWNECMDAAFGEYRRVLSYLSAHPRAFHKALAVIDRRFLVFALNAYQSFLFNEVLGRRIDGLARKHGFPVRSLKYAFGTYLFPMSLAEAALDELCREGLPVPGYDTEVPDPVVRAIVEDVVGAEGIRLSDLRVRQMPRLSAHGVLRPAMARAAGLSEPRVESDDLYPGRKKLSFSFFLPRGSYATILVKRICLPAGAP